MDYPNIIPPSEFDARNKDNRAITKFDELEKLYEQLKGATTRAEIDEIKKKLEECK